MGIVRDPRVLTRGLTICSDAPSQLIQLLCVSGLYHGLMEHLHAHMHDSLLFRHCEDNTIPYGAECFHWWVAWHSGGFQPYQLPEATPLGARFSLRTAAALRKKLAEPTLCFDLDNERLARACINAVASFSGPISGNLPADFCRRYVDIHTFNKKQEWRWFACISGYFRHIWNVRWRDAPSMLSSSVIRDYCSPLNRTTWLNKFSRDQSMRLCFRAIKYGYFSHLGRPGSWDEWSQANIMDDEFALWPVYDQDWGLSWLSN